MAGVRAQAATWVSLVLFAVCAPIVTALVTTLWRMPHPINEAVALYEDAARRATVWTPDTSYYRPLFYLTLMKIWRGAESLDTRLALISLVHIAPVVLLVVLFLWFLRPRTLLDAAAAAVAGAVLLGSPGLRDNLEIPLSYTAVGMPLLLAVWILVNREPRAWHAPLVVLLTLMAVGFKEQGLVIVPVVVVAWWTGAPGARRSLVGVLVALVGAYIAFRLQWRGKWPLFEQSIGLVNRVIEPSDAVARFGAFPYWIYAYNSLATISNVLLAEPTSGLFSITRDVYYREPQMWEAVHVASSWLMTGFIAVWGVAAVRRARVDGWTPESRTAIALAVALLACGALSFDYSRDRLGGMAVVFYALAGYHAVRAVAARALGGSSRSFALWATALTIAAATWEIRAIGTVEASRRLSEQNQIGWLQQLPQRREKFADRAVYLEIMESMVPQGLTPEAPRQTRYPKWIRRFLGPPL